MNADNAPVVPDADMVRAVMGTWGPLGGRTKKAAQAKASRANGRRGGRPKGSKTKGKRAKKTAKS